MKYFQTVCITPYPSQPFLLLIAANLPHLDVYTINDMKQFLTLNVTPHPVFVCFQLSKHMLLDLNYPIQKSYILDKHTLMIFEYYVGNYE